MHLNIFVSPKCFSHCKGCYSYSRHEKCNQEVSTDNIISFLNYAYSKGINNVTFCGGDPLTRYDIIELLKRTKNIGFKISLDSLGTNLIKNIINEKGDIVYRKIDPKIISKYIDIIGIPIDGSSNSIIKKFRQTNSDTLKEQQQICEKLNECGISICINTVVHKGNINDAKELSNLINKINYISKWQLFKYIPSGKSDINNKELYDISDEQFNEFKNIIECNYNYKEKLQFKDENNRNNAYMMIDNSGDAWIPCYKDIEKNDERKIIGNIKNSNDWSIIISYF